MNLVQKTSEDARVFVRRSGAPCAEGSCVVYWMQRAQRACDNPALDVAVNLGNALRKPVVVFFAAVPFYPGANARHFHFLAAGIADIADGLTQRGIGFVFRAYPDHSLLKFCDQVHPAIVIGDENPLREAEDWRQKVGPELVGTVLDGRCGRDSSIQAVWAGALRGKNDTPASAGASSEVLEAAGQSRSSCTLFCAAQLSSSDWQEDFTRGWTLDRSVPPVNEWRGGNQEALRRLDEFVREKMALYPEGRNRPESDATSRLSPYLHFGHIGPHTVALRVQDANVPETAKKAFLEQLIIRRELAVNFVRFNPVYDSLECLEPWADRSLAQHSSDQRPIVYSKERLESAETHDPLWNAAQKQMVLTGWMHNYLRMYWAKKILEWSPSIASAYQRATWLNDRYQLDGRDPNGYAGIAWAIVGKHDRPWFERPVFGQVRYMSLASTGRKFDSKSYMAQIAKLERAHV